MPLRSAPKLYLDEHVSPRLAVQLRRYGFDAISCQESQTLSLSGADQWALASAQQRAIVTFNFSDFMVLHAEYGSTQKTHWGLILSTEESIGVLLHRLLRLLNTVFGERVERPSALAQRVPVALWRCRRYHGDTERWKQGNCANGCTQFPCLPFLFLLFILSIQFCRYVRCRLL